MAENTPILLEEYLHLHPADLADRLQRLSLAVAQQLLPGLPPKLAAGALAELEHDRQHALFKSLPTQNLTPLLSELTPDVVADLVPALPPVQRRTALDALPGEQRRRVQTFLRFAPHTAGGIMIIALSDKMTVEQVRELLRAQTQEERTEDVAYLYVIDAEGRLVGIVSLRDLVFRRPERRMNEFMQRDVKFLRADDDQEKTAREFEYYHYLGLLVPDKEGRRLVGVVKASDALEVAQTEATEDIQLMVGLSGEERALTP